MWRIIIPFQYKVKILRTVEQQCMMKPFCCCVFHTLILIFICIINRHVTGICLWYLFSVNFCQTSDPKPHHEYTIRLVRCLPYKWSADLLRTKSDPRYCGCPRSWTYICFCYISNIFLLCFARNTWKRGLSFKINIKRKEKTCIIFESQLCTIAFSIFLKLKIWQCYTKSLKFQIRTY